MKTAAGLLVTLAAPSSASAAIIFDNTTTYTGTLNTLLAQGQVNSTEHGNTVTLAGSKRIVPNLFIWFRVFGAGRATFNLHLRFYRNDGPGSAPGTLLWSSGPMPRVIDSGANLPYSITIPDIVVPDCFTCTVRTTERALNMAPMRPADYNPPGVGAAPFGYWRRTGPGPSDWQFTGPAEPPFGPRITALACSVPRDGELTGDGAADGRDLPVFIGAVLAGSVSGNDVCRVDVSHNGVVDYADLPGMVARLLAP